MRAFARVVFLQERCGLNATSSQTNRSLYKTKTSFYGNTHSGWLTTLTVQKSKTPVTKSNLTDRIAVGDLVYLYADRNKTRARDRYLVVEVTGSFCNVQKFVGSQLRSTSYRVKTSECYWVPSEVVNVRWDSDSCSDHLPPMVTQTHHLTKLHQHDQNLRLRQSYRTRSRPLLPRTFPALITFLANHNEPCDIGTHPDQAGDSCANDSESDAPPPPRWSTRERRRPARYEDFDME